VMLGCGGLMAFLVTGLVVTFFFGAFKVEPRYVPAGKIALLITGLNMSCVLPLAVFSAVLIGMERFDVLSGITIVGELARAALVFVCLKLGLGLIGLASVALFISLAEYCAMGIAAKSLYRPMRLGPEHVRRDTFKSLMSFGVYRFVWIVANQLIFYSDSLVIGIALGAEAITYFAIAGSLVNYGRNIVSLVTDTFAPAATRLDAREDLAGLQRLLLAGTRATLVVSLPLCLGFFFLGRQFITLWMGSNYASSAIFLTVLTIPQLLAMPQYVSALVLAGMARHQVLAYLSFAEGVANLLLSIILVRKIGLIGVAWGTVIPNVLCTGLIVPLYTLWTLKLEIREYLRAALPPILCALPVAAVGYLLSHAGSPSWGRFLGEVTLIGSLFGAMAYFLCLDAPQRASLSDKVNTLLRREVVVHGA